MEVVALSVKSYSKFPPCKFIRVYESSKSPASAITRTRLVPPD